MKESDLPQVRKLIEKLDELFDSGHDISLETIGRTYAGMKSDDGTYRNLVAVSAGEVIGFISAVFYKTFFHSGGTGLINELVVREDCRGKGIGEALVGRFKEIAVERGMNEIEVSTSFGNTKAIQFYKKIGLRDESIILGEELAK